MMILNLDHLEDSSLEVLLHELRKAEEAIGAGERSPEAIENAAKLARAAGRLERGDGRGAAAAERRAVRDAVASLAGDEEPDGIFYVRRARARRRARGDIFMYDTLYFVRHSSRRRRASQRVRHFAFLSNSAARRDRFSAATLAAFLAAPALCVRLFLARYFESEVRGETDPRRDVHPRHPPR